MIDPKSKKFALSLGPSDVADPHQYMTISMIECNHMNSNRVLNL